MFVLISIDFVLYFILAKQMINNNFSYFTSIDSTFHNLSSSFHPNPILLKKDETNEPAPNMFINYSERMLRNSIIQYKNFDLYNKKSCIELSGKNEKNKEYSQEISEDLYNKILENLINESGEYSKNLEINDWLKNKSRIFISEDELKTGIFSNCILRKRREAVYTDPSKNKEILQNIILGLNSNIYHKISNVVELNNNIEIMLNSFIKLFNDFFYSIFLLMNRIDKIEIQLFKNFHNSTKFEMNYNKENPRKIQYQWQNPYKVLHQIKEKELKNRIIKINKINDKNLEDSRRFKKNMNKFFEDSESKGFNFDKIDIFIQNLSALSYTLDKKYNFFTNIKKNIINNKKRIKNLRKASIKFFKVLHHVEKFVGEQNITKNKENKQEKRAEMDSKISETVKKIRENVCSYIQNISILDDTHVFMNDLYTISFQTEEQYLWFSSYILGLEHSEIGIKNVLKIFSVENYKLKNLLLKENPVYKEKQSVLKRYNVTDLSMIVDKSIEKHSSDIHRLTENIFEFTLYYGKILLERYKIKRFPNKLMMLLNEKKMFETSVKKNIAIIYNENIYLVENTTDLIKKSIVIFIERIQRCFKKSNQTSITNNQKISIKK